MHDLFTYLLTYILLLIYLHHLYLAFLSNGDPKLFKALSSLRPTYPQSCLSEYFPKKPLCFTGQHILVIPGLKEVFFQPVEVSQVRSGPCRTGCYSTGRCSARPMAEVAGIPNCIDLLPQFCFVPLALFLPCIPHLPCPSQLQSICTQGALGADKS